MSEPTTYYLQSRWNTETGWGPPFDRNHEIDRAMECLRTFRERFPQKEFRLVKLVEVGV